MHEVLVNHLGGLSLPRKSVVSLTDRPDMTLDVTVDIKQHQNKQTMEPYLMSCAHIRIFHNNFCKLFIKKPSKKSLITMASGVVFNVDLFMIFLS